MQLSTDRNQGFDQNSIKPEEYQTIQDAINLSTRHSTAYTSRYYYTLHNLGTPTNWLVELFWNTLSEHLSDKTMFRVRGHKCHWDDSEENTSLRSIKNTMSYCDYADEAEDPQISIQYYFYYKGQNAIFNTIDKATDEELPRLKNVELALTDDRYHKIRVIKDKNNTIYVISNKFEPESSIYKVLGLLPCLYPEVKTAAEQDPLLYNLCKNLYETDTEALLTTLLQIISTLSEKMAARILDDFKKAMTSTSSGLITSQQTAIAHQQDYVNSLYESLKQAEDKLYREKLKGVALQLNPATVDEQAIALVQNSKTIKLINCNDRTATFKITTPITNYSIKDVAMWYKHPDRPNTVTQYPWIAELFKQTFIQNKYECLLTTIVTMPWDENQASWAVEADSKTQTGNPHLTRYRCFSQTQYAVAELLRDSKVLQALNALIACCASISFTDSAVINYFVAHLTTNGKDQPLFRNVTTSEFISTDTFKKRYNEAQAAVQATLAG